MGREQYAGTRAPAWPAEDKYSSKGDAFYALAAAFRTAAGHTRNADLHVQEMGRIYSEATGDSSKAVDRTYEICKSVLVVNAELATHVHELQVELIEAQTAEYELVRSEMRRMGQYRQCVPCHLTHLVFMEHGGSSNAGAELI